MANLFKQLQALKTNVFGGPGNTGETKPPATRVQDIDLQASPTGLASSDPFNFQTLSYPSDVTNNYQNGHYMLFYVNVQNKTKYTYTTDKVLQIPKQGDKGKSPSEINQKTKEELRKGAYAVSYTHLTLPTTD